MLHGKKTVLSVFTALLLAAVSASGGEVQEGMAYREKKNELLFTWEAKGFVPETENAKINGLVKAYIEETIGESIRENATQFTLDEDVLDDGKGMWSVWFDGDVSHPSDNVVSVRVDFFTFAFKAAHPLGVATVKNYRLADGAELTLDKLFRDPQKALEIMARLAPELVKEHFKKNNPADIIDGMDEMFNSTFKGGFDPTRANYAALALEPGGVRVIFQQYQVLPYVFGMPEALVPLKDLEPAGPNPEVWPAGKGGAR